MDNTKIKLENFYSTDKPIKEGSLLKNLTTFLNKDYSFKRRSITDKDKESFYGELYILLSSEVDIQTTLELIVDQEQVEFKRKIYNNIREEVVKGASFSKSLYKTTYFSNYECFNLEIGEESGRLLDVLIEMHNYFQKRIKQQRQLVSALTYPAIVISIAFLAIYFMLNFVVPMFSDVFKRFNSELPAITKWIIELSKLFDTYIGYLLLFMMIFGWVVFNNRNKNWFRQYGSAFLLKVPVVGKMIQLVYLARFCQAMNLLISSKTPLVTALTMAQKMVDFYPIEHSLSVIRQNVVQGSPLHTELMNFNIYTKRMVYLVKVGEQVNQLDKAFATLAKQFSDEVEHQSGILASLIEPIMIVALGVIVSVILIAMYLPLFQLSSSVH